MDKPFVKAPTRNKKMVKSIVLRAAMVLRPHLSIKYVPNTEQTRQNALRMMFYTMRYIYFRNGSGLIISAYNLKLFRCAAYTSIR